LLLLHAAIDVTIAGSNAPPHSENPAAASSKLAASGGTQNETQATAATTNAETQRRADRRSNVSDAAQANGVISLAASPEITKPTSAGEARETEQPLIGLPQGSESPTVEAIAGAQGASSAVEESGAKSAESPAGEVPEAPMAATPITQTDAASARATRLSLSTDEVAALLARGDFLIAKGDVASARLFYERAAEAGQGQAALRLGESYDPAFLARVHLSGVRGDALAAARWYRRARELGTSEAATLLETLPPEKDQRLP
jgi:TPR repeat protein